MHPVGISADPSAILPPGAFRTFLHKLSSQPSLPFRSGRRSSFREANTGSRPDRSLRSPVLMDNDQSDTIPETPDESSGGFWPTGEEIAAMPRSLDAEGNVTAIGPDLDADHRRRFDAFKRTSRAARRTSPILRGPAPRIVGCHSRQRRAAPTRSRGSRRGTAARSSSSDSSDGSGSSDSDDGDPERLGPPSPSCSPSNRRASA